MFRKFGLSRVKLLEMRMFSKLVFGLTWRALRTCGRVGITEN